MTIYWPTVVHAYIIGAGIPGPRNTLRGEKNLGICNKCINIPVYRKELRLVRYTWSELGVGPQNNNNN